MSDSSPAALASPPGLWRGELLPRTLAISSGIGLHAFNEISIAPVVPLALEALDALRLLPWIYALFFAGVIAGGMTAAALRARLGPRGAMLAAGALYLAGVLGTATATDATWLLSGRAVQGVADGWIVAICYSLIPELFPAVLVTRVFSVEAVIWAGAAVLGPLAAGVATEAVGWRAGLVVSLPLLLLLLVMTPRTLPAGGERQEAIPLGRHMWVIVVSVGATLLFSLPSVLPGGGPVSLALPAAALVFVAVFLLDRNRREPFFPPRLFGFATTAGLGSWVILLMSAGQSMSTVFLAHALHVVFALSPVWTGFLLVTMAMTWSIVALPVGRVTDPALRRLILRTGPAFQLVGMLLIGTGLALGALPVVLAGQVVVGTGFAFVWAITNQSIMADAAPADRTRTSALLPATATAGYVMGAGLGGWVAARSDLIATLGTEAGRVPVLVLWSAGAVLAAAALAAAQGMRPRV